MKRVRLRLPSGGVHPVYRLLTDSPSVERAEGIYWHLTDDGTLTMLHRVVADLESLEETVADVDQLEAFEVLAPGRPPETSGPPESPTIREGYLFVRDAGTADSRALFGAFSVAGVVAIPPIEYGDDGATFTVVGEDAAIQRALESIPPGLELEVTKIGAAGGTIDPAGTLSDRQREAARVGVELGYFDVPRRASHEAVAAALGCAPSTAAEHLQKAQAALVRSAFEDATNE